jgi:hypothetical protein
LKAATTDGGNEQLDLAPQRTCRGNENRCGKDELDPALPWREEPAKTIQPASPWRAARKARILRRDTEREAKPKPRPAVTRRLGRTWPVRLARDRENQGLLRARIWDPARIEDQLGNQRYRGADQRKNDLAAQPGARTEGNQI